MTDALGYQSKTSSGRDPRRPTVRSRAERRPIHSMNPDGSDRKVIVTDVRLPDGIVVDVEAGHIYWTNMGIPNLNDGSIERADLDGGNRRVIVPPGRHAHAEAAPSREAERQALLVRPRRHAGDARQSRRHRSRDAGPDRPGRGRPSRRRRDGASESPSIPSAEQIYWTQKGPDNAGLGRIFRAGIEIPEG